MDPDASQQRERRLTGARLVTVALGIVLLVQAAFVLSYVGALHHPSPHRDSLGVVGVSPLPAAVGKQFSLGIRRYPTETAARAAIDHRTIDGALVAAPSGARLIVVPAAGASGAIALANAFGSAAAALHRKLAVVQAHPLPDGDEGGNVSFLVVMALIVGGYLSSTITTVLSGTSTRRGRLVSLGLVTAAGALLTDVIAGPILDAIPTSKFLVL